VTYEENSQYFIHNERLAKEWENLASELGGEIVGEVNSFILEFDLSFQIETFQIKIKFLRQTSNKHTGTLYDNGMLMTTNTIIDISPINGVSKNWKIVSNSTFNKIRYRLLGFATPLDFDRNYLKVSESKYEPSQLVSLKVFNYLKRVTELRSIVQKDSHLIIEYYNSLGADSTMRIVKLIINSRR